MIKNILASFLSFSLAGTALTLGPEARTVFLQGNYYAAENLLNTMEEKEPNLPLIPLYRGYIQQAQGHYTQAGGLFHAALSQTLDEKTLQEVVIAEGLNALLSSQNEKLSLIVERAKKSSSLFPHVHFLNGVNHYVKGNFQEAGKALHTYREAIAGYEKSAWIDYIMEKYFPKEEIDLYIAHTLIERGEYTAARELLMLKDDEHSAPFLALSYLKECCTLPLSERGSYEKLATFYFERAGGIPPLAKANMILHIQNEMLKHKMPPLALIKVLEKWRATQALDLAADKVAAYLFEAPQALDATACPLFSTLLHKKLVQQLKEKKPEKLLAIWKTFESSSLATVTMKKEIATFLGQEIVHGLQDDDEKLEHTIALCSLWKEFEDETSKIQELSTELLHHGKLLWLKDGQEKKGSLTMRLALSIAPRALCKEHEKNALRFFANLYSQAEKSNLVHRLLLIHEALESLGLRLPTAPGDSCVANYLADAAYLFKARNYQSAGVHAELIMKLEPSNEKALRLFGLSLYHLGEYKRAMAALKKLDHPDEYAEKALMLSIAHTSSEKEKHLVQVDRLDEMDEED